MQHQPDYPYNWVSRRSSNRIARAIRGASNQLQQEQVTCRVLIQCKMLCNSCSAIADKGCDMILDSIFHYLEGHKSGLLHKQTMMHRGTQIYSGIRLLWPAVRMASNYWNSVSNCGSVDHGFMSLHPTQDAERLLIHCHRCIVKYAGVVTLKHDGSEESSHCLLSTSSFIHGGSALWYS